MKKLYIIVSFLICSYYCFGQFPLQQSLGSPTTQVYSKGGLGSDSGFVYRTNFPDTTTANRGFLKNIPGIAIRTGNTLWMRNQAATAWLIISTTRFGIEDNLGLQDRSIDMQTHGLDIINLYYSSLVASYTKDGFISQEQSSITTGIDTASISPSSPSMQFANSRYRNSGNNVWATSIDANIDSIKLYARVSNLFIGTNDFNSIMIDTSVIKFAFSREVNGTPIPIPAKIFLPHSDLLDVTSPTRIAVWSNDTLKSAAISALSKVANGLTKSVDTTILGDSLNRFTYIQVLSHLEPGTRFNHLRLGNLPESQSIGGTVPPYPYVATYNPSTFSIDRLYSEANHDTSYLQYGGGISGVTRFNFDSVGIYGATLPRPKEIVMPSQGVEYLYQINLPRDSVRFGIGRDGQQASVFVAQHDWGQTWGYNTNVYSATGITGMPISTYKANLDFQRNIDNTRRYKMTGNGVAQYLSAYKTYQTTINGSTYEAGDYVSRVVGFDAFGTMYQNLSTDTKAKTLSVSTVDSSIGFRAHPQYRYTNDIKNGYGFWAEGDSDYNHYQGFVTIAGTFPTRQNGGQDFQHRLTVNGDIWSPADTTHGFIVDGYGMSVQIPKSVGDEAGIVYLQKDSAQTAATGAYILGNRELRGFYIRSEGYNGSIIDNNSTGFFVQVETGVNHANVTRWWRNGNMVVNRVSGTTDQYRLYKNFLVNGASGFLDTVTIKNIPIAPAGDTTNYFNLGIASNGDIYRVSYGSGGGGSGTVTSVGSGYGLSGGPITTTGTLLFDSTIVFPQIRTSIFANVPDTRVLYSNAGAVGHSTQFTFTGQALQLASTNTTQTTTSSALAQTYNSLTSGTGQYMTLNGLTSGIGIQITTNSTAKAAGNALFKGTSSGANGTSTITNVIYDGSNTNTGTSSTNVVYNANASGATNNWAFRAETGNFRSTGAAGFYALNSAGTGGVSMSYDNSTIATVGTTGGGIRLDLEAASSTILARRPFIIGIGIDFGNNVALDVYKSASGTSNIQNWRSSGGTVLANVNQSGSLFIGGSTSATALMHLAAGTTAASTAPFKLTTGPVNTTAETGALEYTTPQLFFTNGAAVRQELFQGQQSRVSTQFDKTNTTLADITGLTANVAAGKTYRFEATLYTTSDVAGGVKVAIAGTATATAIIYEGLTTNAGTITQSRATALATAVGAVTAVTAAYIKVTGTITVNAAGTLTCQFAENAATATSSVLVGSTFVVTEML